MQDACFRVINVTQIEWNEFQGRPRVQSRHAMQNGIQNLKKLDEWPNVMRDGRDWWTSFDPLDYAVAFMNAIKFAAATAANFSNFWDNGTACRCAAARAHGNFALIRLYYRRGNYWKVFARIKTGRWDRLPTVSPLCARLNSSWSFQLKRFFIRDELSPFWKT